MNYAIQNDFYEFYETKISNETLKLKKRIEKKASIEKLNSNLKGIESLNDDINETHKFLLENVKNKDDSKNERKKIKTLDDIERKNVLEKGVEADCLNDWFSSEGNLKKMPNSDSSEKTLSEDFNKLLESEKKMLEAMKNDENNIHQKEPLQQKKSLYEEKEFSLFLNEIRQKVSHKECLFPCIDAMMVRLLHPMNRQNLMKEMIEISRLDEINLF